MTAEQLGSEIAPPRTRTCRICSVEINAASARCPYCGTRQFKYRTILGWRGVLVCVVAIAAAVLITRAVIDASRPHATFAAYDDGNIAELVPAGYQPLVLTAPHGTDVVGFVNPGQPADTVTVQATLDPPGTPRSRTRALAAALAKEPGIATGYVGSVVFPGGQVAWSAWYQSARPIDRPVLAYYAVFAFDACGGSIGMTVTLSAKSASALRGLSNVLPQSAEPICNGSAYSNRDRADPTVPLTNH
jgi:RNA polymerase subunit RPABC4/transcription elongation factor Spt4